MKTTSKPLIIGNWKMHKTVPEARDFIRRLEEILPTLTDREVVIAPPFTALLAVAGMTVGTSIKVSAQNLHWEEKGAFTGEVSAAMVADCGCEYVIIGHSERRTLFGETDETVNRKTRTALANGLRPVICVGETLAERESDATLTVVATQIKEGLKGIPFDGIRRVVIAYEPVWAIGTGKTATPGQAQEVHRFIREDIEKAYTKDVADGLPILYGGSVHPDNIDYLMAERDIDGVLVGGASLDAESFARIILFE
ncbi:MAG TPA: triose-phosphate isomerase [Syntrophales bacterium]|nr:triose-phosphate isomerase [Syntrophales bacterium]HRT27934.1 triose-phosphate isomerase [Syntrophales bacterium]HRT70627.1 triose-phosphate isomerase [Syntrophales bacterium]